MWQWHAPANDLLWSHAAHCRPTLRRSLCSGQTPSYSLGRSFCSQRFPEKNGDSCWWDFSASLPTWVSMRKTASCSPFLSTMRGCRLKKWKYDFKKEKAKTRSVKLGSKPPSMFETNQKGWKLQGSQRDLSTDMDPTGVSGHPPSPRESSTSARGEALNLKQCWWRFHKEGDSDSPD